MHCATCRCEEPAPTHDKHGVPLSRYHALCPGCEKATAISLLKEQGWLCMSCRKKTKPTKEDDDVEAT